MDKWDYFQNGSQNFFIIYILIFLYFFNMKPLSEVSAWSFCHSDPDPDPSSVYNFDVKKLEFSVPIEKLKQLER